MKTSDIRSTFVKYFEKNGHVKQQSSPLVPQNDPTLLFANAGMNQFKDYFTGKATPETKRATTIQKCVRAGGKHNDLENVGFTARHHTFFEMLGNFSFGDYFKKDAIHFAWELLTKEFGIDKNKLLVTVHDSDQEAADIWHKQEGVPRDRIFYKGDKDNFWEMGDFGPCGPCSEIFYDHGPQHSIPGFRPGKGQDILDDEGRYVEIWNLVFMQYEKTKDGQFSLPNPSIDTGAGLERLSAALQGKYWNYDIDSFWPILDQIQKLSGKEYSDVKYTSSMRVVADHIRACTMLITDGVIPSNEGRGYVLRRIIRRAARHLRELGVKDVSFYKLIDPVMQTLGGEYPQNLSNVSLAQKFLQLEEAKFLETLDVGLKFLNDSIKKDLKGDTLSGKVAFKLYDTYGFPLDLTEVILQERNLKLDQKGFDQAMSEQKEKSKKSWKGNTAGQDHQKLFYSEKDKHGATDFLGYQYLEAECTLLSILDLDENNKALIFDQTPFYAESGGQVGDIGNVLKDGLPQCEITDTQKPVDELFVHYTQDASNLNEGEKYILKVNGLRRKKIMRNHSATHLLQSALIKTLGDHVKQAGSYVDETKLRFDFTHPQGLTDEEKQKVETLVNDAINNAFEVAPEILPKEKALEKGAMALFGEKYGDMVRIIEMGDVSVEFCGGTHVSNTSDIGLFMLLSESSLSSGIRRIEATTSQNAINILKNKAKILDNVAKIMSVNYDKVEESTTQLKSSVKKLTKDIENKDKEIQTLRSSDLFENPEAIGNYVFKAVKAPAKSNLRDLSDNFVSKYKNGILFLYNVENNKVSALIRKSKDVADFDSSKILKECLQVVSGRGGGRAEMAQGQGQDISKVDEFTKQTINMIKDTLK